MRRYFCNDGDGQIIIGRDREIRFLYRSLKRHGYTPLYVEEPKFKNNSIYGIDITNDGFYTVINSETLVRLLLAGVI